MIWTREYNDGSKDMIVYNPAQTVGTVEGITSDAKVLLLHANATGNWQTGRLFGATTAPVFSGFPTMTVVTLIGGTPVQGAQYDVSF